MSATHGPEAPPVIALWWRPGALYLPRGAEQTIGSINIAAQAAVAEALELGGEAGWAKMCTNLASLARLRRSLMKEDGMPNGTLSLRELLEGASGAMFDTVVRETAADTGLNEDLVRRSFDPPASSDPPELTAARERVVLYFSHGSRGEARTAMRGESD